MPISRQSLRNLSRQSLIAFGVFVLLFILVDNVLMPWFTEQGKSTAVPSVVGLPLEEAKVMLTQAGLVPKEAEIRPDKQFPIGTVAFQVPPPNAEVKYGRGIYLTVSGGEIMVSVPNLRGKSLREAVFTLERAGLRMGDVPFTPSEDIFMNTVISQSVEPGRKARSGSSIAIVVSQGKPGEKRAVPNVTLKSLTEAQRLLLQAGFKVGAINHQVSQDLLPNTVIEQYPKAGELAVFGQAVDLFVAQKVDPRATMEN